MRTTATKKLTYSNNPKKETIMGTILKIEDDENAMEICVMDELLTFKMGRVFDDQSWILVRLSKDESLELIDFINKKLQLLE